MYNILLAHYLTESVFVGLDCRNGKRRKFKNQQTMQHGIQLQELISVR